MTDSVCTAGPHDRPFEEMHDTVCIAAVTEGTFQYRTESGGAVLRPGGVILGNAGACFECGHEHTTGDRCLAFHFAPEHLESIVADVPGVRRSCLCSAEPAAAARAHAAARGSRGWARRWRWHESWRSWRCGSPALWRQRSPAAAGSARSPSRRDARRVSDALRRIEAAAHEPLALADLAREAATSPYHFLRTFRQVVGMTPHQFVLHTRMRRAAVRLRTTDEPISTIAFDAGFGDLSTFNRRFRRLMGCSPGAYRKARRPHERVERSNHRP